MPEPAKSQGRNWTIVQMLYRDPRPVSDRYPAGWKSREEKYVVLDGLKSRSQEAVTAWLDEDPRRRRGLCEVHFYPRNYVDDFRALTAAGRVIPALADSEREGGQDA